MEINYQQDKSFWIAHIPDELAFCSVSIPDLMQHQCDFFGVDVPERIRRSVRKRQYEFIAGRLCAQVVCKELNDKRNIINQCPHGRPIWPPGIVGSISHSSQIAVCAASQNKKIKAIGIDSEIVTNDDKIISSIKNLVMVKNEESLIEKFEDYFLIFSLKESLFKCLNPFSNLIFDFKEIKVSEINKKKGLTCLKFCSTGKFPARMYCGWFSIVNNHVHSCIYLI